MYLYATEYEYRTWFVTFYSKIPFFCKDALSEVYLKPTICFTRIISLPIVPVPYPYIGHNK